MLGNYGKSALLTGLFLAAAANAYEVSLTDKDYSPQVCAGMWGGQNVYINVSFDDASQGQLAMVIYEWSDNEMLGKVTSTDDDDIPKTYVCTTDAVRAGFCGPSQLGGFILDLPTDKTVNETSFWTARVSFESPSPNPPGVPVRDTINPSPSGLLQYKEPIVYQVRKTGYYCVAAVPVTVLSMKRQEDSDAPHPSWQARVLFHNSFGGQLPASDYPKVNFYFFLFLAYLAVGGAWGWLCYKHRDDLLPIQYYLSGLVGFLVVEMLANWAYYRYLNAHGKGTVSTIFLFVVAILDAGRNALSFFMLLVVSLGLSVVVESLGRTMTRCQLLAGAHFVFGVLYAVGIVELELESTSALVLVLFVIPLAFTLSGFLLWIMYALNATISLLAQRHQNYKLRMFKRLYYILLGTVVVIGIFFVVSSFSFSNRLADDFAAKSWQYRWWLLDGWLALLYLVAFSGIAYLWRPTTNNSRYVYFISMFDELAQNPEDAEDYDLESLEGRLRHKDDDDDDDDATLIGGGRRGPASPVGEDAVVFEIGDQDLSDDEDKSPGRRRSGQYVSVGESHEREGLIGDDQDKDADK